MLRFLSLLTLLLCLGATSYAQRFEGSGDLVKQERSVKDFTGVSFSHAIHTEIRRGGAYSVVVEADDNVIDRVKTDVRGDLLKVTMDGNSFENVTVNVTITMPSLQELRGSGAARGQISGFREDKMRIDFSGAAHLEFSDTTVGELALEASGAIRLDLDDLQARTADIDVAGASNVSLHVTEEVSGDVSGASNVRNKGGANTRVNSSGAARFRSN